MDGNNKRFFVFLFGLLFCVGIVARDSDFDNSPATQAGCAPQWNVVAILWGGAQEYQEAHAACEEIKLNKMISPLLRDQALVFYIVQMSRIARDLEKETGLVLRNVLDLATVSEDDCRTFVFGISREVEPR